MNISSIRENGVVINTMGHQDTLDDFLEYVSQHIGEWKDCQVLWDLTQLDFEEIRGISIRNLISNGKEISQERSGLKTAFFVDSDLGFGMMRMFQLIAEYELAITFNVFKSKDSAIAWLEE